MTKLPSRSALMRPPEPRVESIRRRRIMAAGPSRPYIEPEFSYVTDTAIYGAYNGPGTNLRQIDQFDVTTGATTQWWTSKRSCRACRGTYVGGIESSAGPTERIM